MGRPAPGSGHVGQAGRAFVAGFEQLAVLLSQLLHAAGQGAAPFLEPLLLERLVSLDERQIELVAEVEPLPASGPKKIQDFISRHAARPVDEALRAVELVELVPEDQARLLEQVVGVVQVTDERVNITEELGLMLPQERGVVKAAALRAASGLGLVRARWKRDRRSSDSWRIPARPRADRRARRGIVHIRDISASVESSDSRRRATPAQVASPALAHARSHEPALN